MKTYVNTRKGMTLAEIMVAIALIAVMITLVVSFVFMMSEQVQTSQANNALLGDIKKIEAAVEGWVDVMSRESAAFSAIAASDGRYLAADFDDKDRCTVEFSGNTLVLEFSEEKKTELRTECVKNVNFFKVLDKGEENNKDYLVFCTVTCVNEKTGNEFEYTFAVNSRIGETYTTVTEETTAEPEPAPDAEAPEGEESEGEGPEGLA